MNPVPPVWRWTNQIAGSDGRCEAITARGTRCRNAAFWNCVEGAQSHIGHNICPRHFFARRGFW